MSTAPHAPAAGRRHYLKCARGTARFCWESSLPAPQLGAAERECSDAVSGPLHGFVGKLTRLSFDNESLPNGTRKAINNYQTTTRERPA